MQYEVHIIEKTGIDMSSSSWSDIFEDADSATDYLDRYEYDVSRLEGAVYTVWVIAYMDFVDDLWPAPYIEVKQ